MDKNTVMDWTLYPYDRMRGWYGLLSGNKTDLLPGHFNFRRCGSTILVQIAFPGDGGDVCDGVTVYPIWP